MTLPLQVITLALVLSWNLLDYPLTMRGVPMRRRAALLRENWPTTLGFGLGFAVVFMVPCGAVLLLPAGVAGATRIATDWLRAESADDASVLVESDPQLPP